MQELTLASELENGKSTITAETTTPASTKAGKTGNTEGASPKSEAEKSSEQPPLPPADEEAAVAEWLLTPEEKQIARVPCMWNITKTDTGVSATNERLSIVFEGSMKEFNKKYLRA